MDKDAEFIRKVRKVMMDNNIILYYKVQKIKEDMGYYDRHINAIFIQQYLTNYEQLQRLLG
jgi:hypothetical protein